MTEFITVQWNMLYYKTYRI